MALLSKFNLNHVAIHPNGGGHALRCLIGTL